MTSEAGTGSDMDATDANILMSGNNLLSNAVQEDDEDDDMPTVSLLIKHDMTYVQSECARGTVLIGNSLAKYLATGVM